MRAISFLRDMVHDVLFSRRTFDFLQGLKINLTKNYHYSSIPDVALLRARNVWALESSLCGVAVSDEKQLDHTRKVVAAFGHECNFPLVPTGALAEYYVSNGLYGWICATLYYSLIRHYKPRRIIEVGAGMSTYLAAEAVLRNQVEGFGCVLTAIEPYPNETIKAGFRGLSNTVQRRVEDLDPSFFEGLDAGDILFIDSTHTVRTGGDVTYLFLEVLPRLRSGVLVHVHDVFLPQHYPEDWIVRKQYFWAEQYLLQAFLAFNESFEILWAGNYLATKYPEEMKELFPLPAGVGQKDVPRLKLKHTSNSFWMRRTKS